MTPLLYSARNGHINVVEYLVGKGAEKKSKNKEDKTPLDLASQNCHQKVVEFLKR